ncbi:hypothetical protein BCR33DRAFT_710894 [Rhizoclosmatium globosum]|uniref:Uncharacterized protein n=1 Tax=Rhizoclosmatium globosum TaxID=329046 RepID=A0A1Y2D2X1_9FUNG|nr:hypothetical protein BCR33DRAFT_710894 [Rhizoclosmatium globosum]|eukprot:ORY53474.1 hypothetical protein BCR33DRAFT_710894 [Rhizoclosmatium globosum]
MKINATILTTLTFMFSAASSFASPSQPRFLPCTFQVEFPVGSPASEEMVKTHLDSFDISYHIRTSINNQYANFVSFTINGDCDYDKQVATIPHAIKISRVKEVASPNL